jgi:uroporphyrinogen-III synthase
LARRLRLAGLDPITVDTISLAPPSSWRDVDRFLNNLSSFDWVVFTSPSGARYFGTRMKALSLRLSWEGSPRVAAVGRQTARALSALGVKPDFVPTSYTTRILGKELPAKKGNSILLLRSDIADPGLASELVERGFSVEEAAIYRTISVGKHDPSIKDAGMIVFASPSAVKGFCALVTAEELQIVKGLRAVCIGPVTELAARVNGFLNTTKPESFTLDAVVQEIERLSQADA